MKTMTVNASTAINFRNPIDVKAYRMLSPEARPENDTEYTEVTEVKIGYENIILIGANGNLLAKLPRRRIRGLAIEGAAFPPHGPNFRRTGFKIDDGTIYPFDLDPQPEAADDAQVDFELTQPTPYDTEETE